MEIKYLIDAAKEKSGQSLGELADEMHISQTRISEWKKGKYRPGASQIVFLAEKANLPAIKVLAEIEGEWEPSMASYWQKAVTQLSVKSG
jgi:transcriptional regulator with XRE-family HTH domain